MNTELSHSSSTPALNKIAPVIRGLMAEPSGDEDQPWRPVILSRLCDADAVAFANGPTCSEQENWPEPLKGLAGPPLCLDLPIEDASLDKLKEAIETAWERHVEQNDAKPQIVCLKGLGVLYPSPSQTDPLLPLAGRVAIVTGAAGAIGHGVCKGLLAAGAYVAASDLPGEALERTVEEFSKSAPGRVLGVAMDVTDAASVAQGFGRVAEAWGGVDCVIVNAGLAHVAALEELSMETFRRLERVNVEGTLLTLAEAGRAMKLQGTGGDIVLVSTKNVFAPGARFGAYSATKAAAHQLARIASLELAEFDIRVNMVAPDAVFSDGAVRSGLWASVGPDRMKARGLDEKGLEEYYRGRNLLKARVTARHVANAVLFFATRQTPTTGATIPVDGGLPDATPR